MTDWESRCLPLTGDTVTKVKCGGFSASPGPATIFAGTLTIAGAPADTFLLMDGWAKGNVWVNGFNVGRYWQTKGPQRTLYIPGIKLQSGANDIRVLELDNASVSPPLPHGPSMHDSPPTNLCLGPADLRGGARWLTGVGSTLHRHCPQT